MSKRQRIVTTVVTLLVAAGVGHVSQYGWLSATGTPVVRDAPEPKEPEFTPLPSRPDSTLLKVSRPIFPAPTTDALYLDLPDPADAALTYDLPAPEIRISAPVDRPERPPTDEEINLNAFGLTCGVEHNLSPELGGLLRLRVITACAPGSRVDVTHAGLTFSLLTGEAGAADVLIPVLTETAEITYSVDGATPVTDQITIPDASAYRRVALSWSGEANLSIHALEFGAGPGSDGHVTHARASLGEGPGDTGRIVRLGDRTLDQGYRSEIYSFPADQAGREGTIRLSVAARVTEAVCGSDLDITTVQRDAAGNAITMGHSLPLPECTDVGDILVLKNILNDLKIAQN